MDVRLYTSIDARLRQHQLVVSTTTVPLSHRHVNMWKAHESEHHAIDAVNIDIGMIDHGLFWGLPCVSDPNVLRVITDKWTESHTWNSPGMLVVVKLVRPWIT
jgi:hypothetical protein